MHTSSNLLNAVAALECKHAANTWDTTWPPLHEHTRLTEKERKSFINIHKINKEMQCYERNEDVSHSAQLATADEDSSLVQHASVQMEHVIHVHCYEILRQISL